MSDPARRPPLLRAEGLVKTYPDGDVQALRGVSLGDRRRASRWRSPGPSGCGKSTLLHLLGGLDRPDRGRGLLRGRAAGRARPRRLPRPAARLRLPVVPPAADPDGPGERAGADVRGPTGPRSERAERAEAAARRGRAVAPRRTTCPRRLSVGERQRVAIARALANEPTLLLLADEPTGNLDSRTRPRSSRLLDRLRRERGLTLVVVTHSPEVAAAADRGDPAARRPDRRRLNARRPRESRHPIRSRVSTMRDEPSVGKTILITGASSGPGAALAASSPRPGIASPSRTARGRLDALAREVRDLGGEALPARRPGRTRCPGPDRRGRRRLVRRARRADQQRRDRPAAILRRVRPGGAPRAGRRQLRRADRPDPTRAAPPDRVARRRSSTSARRSRRSPTRCSGPTGRPRRAWPTGTTRCAARSGTEASRSASSTSARSRPSSSRPSAAASGADARLPAPRHRPGPRRPLQRDARPAPRPDATAVEVAAAADRPAARSSPATALASPTRRLAVPPAWPAC